MKYAILGVLLIVVAGFAFTNGQGDDDDDDDEVDAMTNATQSTVDDAEDVREAVGPDGGWIIIFEDDVTVDSPVTISGAVYETEGAEAPRRKLALYTQDANRNVTDRFTLTVPALVVDHVNTRIQAGTIAGDVYVQAAGFQLRGATIDGDLYFATEEIRDSAEIDGDSTITGKVAIGSM